MRKLTEFTFFKDTPLIDFQNTILFDSNAKRDKHFLNDNHYEKITYNSPFNFIRDRSTISTDTSYEDFQGVNYCTFLSEFEPETRFYAYVLRTEYMNDGNAKAYLLIDSVMTYMQGNTLNTLSNLKVDRQHLSKSQYQLMKWELKNNDDVIKSNTKSYFHGDRLLFDDLLVIISSSADLQANFGDKNDPDIKTSNGKVYDKVTSPLNLYGITIDRFNELMKELNTKNVYGGKFNSFDFCKQ